MTPNESLILRLEDRIFSGEPFTFLALHGGVDAAYRRADRLIQKHRRAGRIYFTRKGREAVWSLTKAGKEYALVRLTTQPGGHDGE